MNKAERMTAFDTLFREKVMAIGGKASIIAKGSYDEYTATLVAEDRNHEGRLYVGECYEIKKEPKCNLRIFKEI